MYPVCFVRYNYSANRALYQLLLYVRRVMRILKIVDLENLPLYPVLHTLSILPTYSICNLFLVSILTRGMK